MSTNIKPDISVILVNYNGRTWLPNCLESLFTQTHSNFEVLLVDNGSTDTSLEFVKENYPQIVVIQNKKNTGFAGGNNIALPHVRGKYCMLLNTDTYITPTCLRDLETSFQKIPNLGCVQPKIIFMHEKDKLDSCGSYFTNTGFLKHIGYQAKSDDPAYSRPFPVFTVKGACMMFPTAILDHTGGLFDETFWCYFEETDFCWRVWLAGYECWYDPSATMYHAMGGTTGEQINYANVHYHCLKNRLSTYTKNLSFLKACFTIPVHIILNLALSLILLLTKQITLAKAIYKALWYWLKNLPMILYKRYIVQKKVRQVPDTHWLPRVTQSSGLKERIKQVYGLLVYERDKRQTANLKK